MAQKFARLVMGTNNVDSCNRTCHAPSVAGLSAVFGSGGGTSSYVARLRPRRARPAVLDLGITEHHNGTDNVRA
ncbi:hypothetical protein [Streptomyces sp. enrichment culture]|uniref:hypothetical protein n=1 Tax=Streptomyces sp. enrichment culture TaxID=1795815 RepID=UPI003F553A71